MNAALALKNPMPSLGPALDALASDVARAWGRSFGVAVEPALDRLERRLAEIATELVAAGTSPADLRRALDHSAEHVIRTWFASVLGEAGATSPASFALLRLAFLDANADGRWSEAFLAPDVDGRGLGAALREHLIDPVPPLRLRPIARQSV